MLETLNPKVYPIDRYGAIFDAHIHTYFDFHDGMITPEQLIKLTIKNGFNWVLAMAHDTVRGYIKIRKLAHEHNLPCIPGIEISTTHNHLLAYGVQEWKVRRDTIDPDEAIEILREQDAAIFLSHPYSKPKKVDYGEWFPELIVHLDIDGIEWCNASTYIFNAMTHKVYRRFPPGRRIAGTDAHRPASFGYSFTQVNVNSTDPDDLIDAMKKGENRPYCKAVPLGIAAYDAVISVVKNKILKRRVVEGRPIIADGDRPFTRIAKGIEPHIDWIRKVLRTPINERVYRWVFGPEAKSAN